MKLLYMNWLKNNWPFLPIPICVFVCGVGAPSGAPASFCKRRPVTRSPICHHDYHGDRWDFLLLFASIDCYSLCKKFSYSRISTDSPSRAQALALISRLGLVPPSGYTGRALTRSVPYLAFRSSISPKSRARLGHASTQAGF